MTLNKQEYLQHEVTFLQSFFSGGAYPFSTHCSSNSSSAEQTIFFRAGPSLLQASMRHDENGLIPSGSCDFVIHSTHFLNGFLSDVSDIKPQASGLLYFSVCIVVQLEKAGVGPHLCTKHAERRIPIIHRAKGVLRKKKKSPDYCQHDPTGIYVILTLIKDSVRQPHDSCPRSLCICLWLVNEKH